MACGLLNDSVSFFLPSEDSLECRFEDVVTIDDELCFSTFDVPGLVSVQERRKA